MDIRPTLPEDPPALAEIYRRAVTELGPRGYSPEQVAAWMTRAPTAERLAELAADGRVRLVAVGEDGRPLAFMDLERDGHIDLFYCSPDAAGQGVGAALYAAVERAARHHGIGRLFADASELSCGFFARRGFTVLEKQVFQLAGVEIFNYAVEKEL